MAGRNQKPHPCQPYYCKGCRIEPKLCAEVVQRTRKVSEERVIESSKRHRALAKARAEAQSHAILAVMKGDIRDDQREAYIKGWLNRGFY